MKTRVVVSCLVLLAITMIALGFPGVVHFKFDVSVFDLLITVICEVLADRNK